MRINTNKLSLNLCNEDKRGNKKRTLPQKYLFQNKSTTLPKNYDKDKLIEAIHSRKNERFRLLSQNRNRSFRENRPFTS